MSASGWSAERGRAVLAALPEHERLILPALQAIQAAFGFIPEGAVALVASTLNVSVADTHGVLTYYPDLLTEQPAPVTVAVCTAEACQATGARDLVAHLGRSVALPGGRSADGEVAVREVFCLGNCALGPAVAVGGRLVGRATPAVLDGLLAAAREQVAR
jgi:formate dehydrogenase subunit gamma